MAQTPHPGWWRGFSMPNYRETYEADPATTEGSGEAEPSGPTVDGYREAFAL